MKLKDDTCKTKSNCKIVDFLSERQDRQREAEVERHELQQRQQQQVYRQMDRHEGWTHQQQVMIEQFDTLPLSQTF